MLAVANKNLSPAPVNTSISPFATVNNPRKRKRKRLASNRQKMRPHSGADMRNTTIQFYKHLTSSSPPILIRDLPTQEQKLKIPPMMFSGYAVVKTLLSFYTCRVKRETCTTAESLETRYPLALTHVSKFSAWLVAGCCVSALSDGKSKVVSCRLPPLGY